MRAKFVQNFRETLDAGVFIDQRDPCVCSSGAPRHCQYQRPSVVTRAPQDNLKHEVRLPYRHPAVPPARQGPVCNDAGPLKSSPT